MNRRSTAIPILSHTLLEAKHNEAVDPVLSVKGTDMEMNYRSDERREGNHWIRRGER